MFQFLTIFPQRRRTILNTYVSFFNELSIEKKNYAQNLSSTRCKINNTRDNPKIPQT
jgi:hypothetical protein